MRTAAVSLCVLVLFNILPANPARSEIDVALLVSSGTRYEGEPAVSENRLVWLDERDHTHHIFLYDLDTRSETAIATGPAAQNLPRIHGNKIVWSEGDTAGTLFLGLWMFNLSTGVKTLVASDKYLWCFRNDVSADKIV